MTEWTDGYRAALADIELVMFNRGWEVTPEHLAMALTDLRQDARVIDHEQTNREKKRRLAAAREALPLPLFGDEP